MRAYLFCFALEHGHYSMQSVVRIVPRTDIAGSIRLPRRRGRESSAEPVIGRAFARPDARPICAGRSFASLRESWGHDCALRPPRRIAYAMLLSEGLAAHSAEFGLDRVNKTDVIGFPAGFRPCCDRCALRELRPCCRMHCEHSGRLHRQAALSQHQRDRDRRPASEAYC